MSRIDVVTALLENPWDDLGVDAEEDGPAAVAAALADAVATGGPAAGRYEPLLGAVTDDPTIALLLLVVSKTRGQPADVDRVLRAVVKDGNEPVDFRLEVVGSVARTEEVGDLVDLPELPASPLLTSGLLDEE